MAQDTTTAPASGIDPQLKRIAAALITGAIAVILDTTIVSVAIHELGNELDASVSMIQWVSTAYLLAMFVAIPVTGWLQSRVGGKRLWMAALTLFLVGSLLCACAWNVESLIAFRVVQGLGGGLMMPLMTTLLIQAAHGQNLGRLMAAVSLPAALGPILGPVIGGLILNYLSWPWLFLVNLPLGIVGLVLAVRLLPSDSADVQGDPADVVGLLLVSPGVVGVIYGLSNVGGEGGFGRTDVLAPLLVGVALLVAFAAWSIRAGDRALVDVRLFSHRALTSSSALLFLAGLGLYGSMLLLPLYWQEVRGEDALGAGLLLIAQGVGALASRTLAGRLTDSIGGRWVAVGGFAVLAVATIPFAFVTSTTSNYLLMGALFVRGLGFGAVTIPLMTGAYVGLERDEVPHASIITRVAMQLGGSFGVAVLAVILASNAAGATSADDIADAFDVAFWWAIGFTVLAVGLSFLLPKRVQAGA